MSPNTNRQLVLALAVTNPLVWLLAGLALLVLALGAVVLMYWAVYSWARHELSIPQKAPLPSPSDRPTELLADAENWPVNPPTPAMVVGLDEHGRPEVLVDESVANECGTLPTDSREAHFIPSLAQATAACERDGTHAKHPKRSRTKAKKPARKEKMKKVLDSKA
jgi:hypothetical protein